MDSLEKRLITILNQELGYTFAEIGLECDVESSTIWRIYKGITESPRACVSDKLRALAKRRKVNIKSIKNEMVQEKQNRIRDRMQKVQDSEGIPGG